VSVHRSKMGKWEVRWREGKRNRSRTFTLKQDAKRFELEANRIRQLGGMLPDPRAQRQAFEDFALTWLARKGGISEETRMGYLRLLSAHVFDQLGHVPLRDFTAPLIYRWQDERLAHGAGPMSLRQARKIIGQVLEHAKGLGLIPDNPALRLQVIERREPRRVAQPASPRQVEGLRGWMLERERVGDAALISVLAYVGVRPQDVLAIEWRHLGDGRLRVEQKNVNGQIRAGLKTGTSKIRTVCVPQTVMRDLREWRLLVGDVGPLVFPRPDRQPWRKTDWANWRRRFFSEAVKATDLSRGFRPYDLRHSAASLFIAAGWTPSEVAHQLGHSIEISARIYMHLIEEMRGRRPQSVDQVIAEARAEPDVRRGFGEIA
jgi:integrase